jgi:hypothetical protein
VLRCILGPQKLDLLLYFVGPNLENRDQCLPERSGVEVRVMAQASTPKRVIYAFGLVVVASVLFLMIYSGMLEGAGEALFDLVKEIVKFFIG